MLKFGLLSYNGFISSWKKVTSLVCRAEKNINCLLHPRLKGKYRFSNLDLIYCMHFVHLITQRSWGHFESFRSSLHLSTNSQRISTDLKKSENYYCKTTIVSAMDLIFKILVLLRLYCITVLCNQWLLCVSKIYFLSTQGLALAIILCKTYLINVFAHYYC